MPNERLRRLGDQLVKPSKQRLKIGIVGFGSLGKYLCDYILGEGRADFTLAFVWNRTPSVVADDPRPEVKQAHLVELEDFHNTSVDLIIEVAHPSITTKYGATFLQHASYYCGSPTCFAEREVERGVREAVATNPHGLYLPAGALWGPLDIQKMANLGKLTGLTITMKKNPGHLRRILGAAMERLEQVKDTPGEHTLYEGPVRGLCPLAPNNVNTMACAAMAASNLGFDGTKGRLVSDKSLEAHIVEVHVEGEGGFSVDIRRYNPAKKNAVTGNATYASFLGSLRRAAASIEGGASKKGGVHFV